MKKILTLTCFSILMSMASYGLTIYGASSLFCTGSIGHLTTDSIGVTPGTWSSSNTAIGTIAASSDYAAYIYGASAGVVTISYTSGGTLATATITVSPSPAPITGTFTLCAGTSTTLSDATPAGTWSVSFGTPWEPHATVDSLTGLVSTATATGFGGSTTGHQTLYYTVPSGCSASANLTITSTDVGIISETYPALCVGATDTKTDGIPGGVWSSSNTAIATIDPSSGVMLGVSSGTVYISYTVSGLCGVASIWDTVTVTSTTTIPVISGPTSVSTGDNISLYAISPLTGTWSSSNTAVATVDATSGIVMGLSAGTATISYTVTGCSGPASGTYVVTVAAFTGISGYVNFSSGAPYTHLVVWLIIYNPVTHDLEAVDSVVTYTGGSSSVHYEFMAPATDSYRVKASVSFDTSYFSAGYLPTYHTSAFFWHDADVFYHTSGVGDINKNINMGAGVSTTGPGFIAGDVTTGANRGTTDGAPVPNQLIYAINSATGAIVQQTYTDATGNYTFTSLPFGTYLIHPELINYSTVPYTGITLSSTHTSATAANFIRHTVSRVISPGSAGVSNMQGASASVAAYPNPASDKLSLVWNETATETAAVSLADVTGKVVYTTQVNMATGSGIYQLSVAGLAEGMYVLSVKSANISYHNKIQIQH